MPAGTITLTNNSAGVNGSGTSFPAELKANDFIVAVVGGVTYTLGVKSVDSATGLTLITAYNGPTVSGVAWTAVPNAALVGITAQVAADVAKAIRGLNLEKANWQQVYSASGTITVTLPDGSQYNGPSWNNIATSLSSKLDKNNNLSEINNKSAARTNLELSYGNTANTVAQGNDPRLSTIDGKSGGTVSSGITVNSTGAQAFVANTNGPDGTSGNRVTSGLQMKAQSSQYDVFLQYYLASGQYHSFRFVQNGSATLSVRDNGAAYAASFNPTSDSRLKLNKERITDALSKVETLSGYTFDLFGERRAGGLAQEIREVLPEVISETFIDRQLPDGTVVENVLAVDYGATFGLVVEAIKELSEKVKSRDSMIEELQNRLKSIDGFDA